MINAKHPKIKGAIVQTMERKLNPLEKQGEWPNGELNDQMNHQKIMHQITSPM
jgi:hypothetical protein